MELEWNGVYRPHCSSLAMSDDGELAFALVLSCPAVGSLLCL